MEEDTPNSISDARRGHTLAASKQLSFAAIAISRHFADGALLIKRRTGVRIHEPRREAQ